MLKTLQSRLKRAGRWLPVLLLPFAAQAQLNYGAANAVNTAGTYTDLGTAGTVITTSSTDDANSAAQSIGFSFTYNGTAFTQFILNTNGLIKLGNTAPSTAALYYENFAGGSGVDPLGPTAGAADVNLIMPFNFDLVQGTGTAEYRVATTGTAPNRVCTIQWKNVSDKSEPAGGAGSQYANFSFQAKLYETTGNIEFVYGPATASANATATRFPNVGLKGSSTASNQVALALKGVPGDPWSATTFINVNYGLQAHNVNKVGLPDAGRTYRFVLGGTTPPITNDDPAGAITLPLTATCTPTNASNIGATTTTPSGYTNPDCGIAVSPKDVWFKFTTAAAGQPGSTSAIVTVTGTPAGQVRVFSSAGGASGPFTSVGCSAGTTNNTQAAPLTLSNLTPATTYYVFVSGYGSNDTQGTFTICVTAPAANDASVAAVYTLTKLPIPQGAPHTVKALISNAGTSPLTNLVVTLAVSGTTTFTNNQTVATLAPGASTTVTFAAYVPATAGTNTVTVSVPADGNNANNTGTVSQVVNTSTYSYATATAPTSSVGYPPSATLGDVAFLNRYTASGTSLNVTQVNAFLVDAGTGASSSVGKTVYAVVLNPATGAVLGRSPNYVITAANVAGTGYTSFTLSTPVAVAAGSDFLVGLAQAYQTGQTTQYYALGVQTESPARVGAYYLASVTNPGAPLDITSGTTPATYRPMIEAVTTSTSAPACTPVSNLSAGTITQTGATISFTAPAGTTAYTVTYTPQGGTPTTVTPAPTASPFTLTGLSSGTSYTVSVVASCSAGANSIPVTTTFTTLVPAPTYATLPYVQDFENWISVAGNKDVPSNNWRNTPTTGDNSWRREDEGFTTASWQYASVETSANPPYRIRFSTGAHSARFHTYGANNGAQGKLDLYVDLSGTSTAPRMLSFDYINPTGLDKLEVFLSTDGGATFSTTPLLTATTNAAFTSKSVAVPGTSATSVLRFQATADLLGDDDIGLDNLRLALVTATRNEALAATVGLYPNPAHQRFTLSVPAGRLTTASATLLNALGQVVRTQPLALPATGGTAEVDVRGLAAGVYSLRLQTADALVIKQVVVE